MEAQEKNSLSNAEIPDGRIIREASFDKLDQEKQKLVLRFAKRLRKLFKDDDHNWITLDDKHINHYIS